MATVGDARAAKRTMTFDAKTGIVSIEGAGQFDTTSIPEAVRAELLGVGVITILGRSRDPHFTFGEMLAGAWGRRSVAAEKPFTDWQIAISQVKADDLLKARKTGGDKITTDVRAECAKQADAWVRTLSSERIARLRTHAAVRAAHAELVGVKVSLDDLLADVTPAAEVVPLDAAAD